MVYGLTHMTSATLSVRPERQPLFVRMSDGSIQNKYELKIMNKTDRDMRFAVTTEGGIKGQTIVGTENALFVPHGRGAFFTVFVRASEANIAREATPLGFRVKSIEQPEVTAEYNTKFNAPL